MVNRQPMIFDSALGIFRKAGEGDEMLSRGGYLLGNEVSDVVTITSSGTVLTAAGALILQNSLVVSGTGNITGDTTIGGVLTAGGAGYAIQFTTTSGIIGVSNDADLIELDGTVGITINNDLFFGANTISGTGDIYAGNLYVAGTSLSGLANATATYMYYADANGDLTSTINMRYLSNGTLDINNYNGSSGAENYLYVSPTAADDWVGMGLGGDNTYVYLEGSSGDITIQASETDATVYIYADESIILNATNGRIDFSATGQTRMRMLGDIISFWANTISGTGDIYAGNFYGDGSNLTGLGSNRETGNYKAGRTALTLNDTSKAVVFGGAYGDTNYTIGICLTNTTDSPPAIYGWVVSVKATTGFTVSFSGPIDSNNYVLEWTAIHDD